MKPIKKLVASGGKYMKDGQEKTRWITVGKLFQRDDGSFVIKLDSQPIGWDGWANGWDFDDGQRQAAPATPAQRAQQEGDWRDVNTGDIPF